MNRLIKTLLTVILLSGAASTAAVPSLESYGKLEQLNRVAISPNGELIAFRRTESKDEDFIVVYSLKESKQVAAMRLKDIDPNALYFTNNNYLILAGSGHASWINSRRSYDVGTAYSFNIKKNKAEKLLQLGEDVAKNRIIHPGQTLGSVSGKSPDGKMLYMPAYIQDKIVGAHAPDYSLLRVNIAGKGRPRIVSKGTKHTRDFFLDSKGEILAREQLHDGTNKHSIDVKDGSKWRTIYSYKSKIPTHEFIGLNADFSALIFARNDDDEHYLQLALQDGAVSSLEGIDSNKSSSGLIQNNHRVVEGVIYAGFSPSYHFFDASLDRKVQDILDVFPGHSVHLSDWSDDWKQIVVRVEGSEFAGDYYLFAEGEQPRFLVKSRFDIRPEDINPIGVTSFKARDGLSIPTLLTLPKSKMDDLKNLPTVVMPHGGPESYDRIGFDFMAQAFASRGFLVVQPQFRGSSGFGKKHLEAGVGQWGTGMQHDLSDAVKAFVDTGYADANRVCIVGASYGGYAALAGATFTPDLYQCAVSIAGVSHLSKMIKADKSRFGRNSWVLDYWGKNISEGDRDETHLKTISPYYFADKIKVPVLLIHGENDTVVEFEQSKLMQKAIKKAKGKVRLVKLKNDDHYLRDGETRIQAVEAMVGFVEQHIGNR